MLARGPAAPPVVKAPSLREAALKPPPAVRAPAVRAPATRAPTTLAQRLAFAAQPHWTPSGHWHKRQLSPRKLAKLSALHPELDIPRKIEVARSPEAPPPKPRKDPTQRPLKLHKHERAEHVEKRKAEIAKAMKDMKRMVEQQRKTGREERKKRREDSVALLQNLPLRPPNKRFAALQLAQRRAARLQAEAKATEPRPAQAKKASA